MTAFANPVDYQHYSKFPGWELAPGFLASIIDRYRPQVVFEIGSGANPTLPISELATRDLRYITSDLSEEELFKAPSGYETRQVDVEGPLSSDLIGTCDMIFSRMVNEHIRDGRTYHTNLFNMLRPGGIAIHCCATLYTLPFVMNYILPNRLSALMLRAVSPRPEYQHGKFQAFYSWSRGPTRRMMRGFQDIGFEVITYTGYFGHGYYELRLPFLHRLEQAKANFLLHNPVPNMCSFATVVLRRPAA